MDEWEEGVESVYAPDNRPKRKALFKTLLEVSESKSMNPPLTNATHHARLISSGLNILATL